MEPTDSKQMETPLREWLATLVRDAADLDQQAAEIAARRRVNREQQQAIRTLLGETEEAESVMRAGVNDLAGASFRAGWRAVLDDTWKKPTEIAELMEARGYSDTTPTPLSSRVGNDLYREAKRGHVEKKKGGYYRRLQRES